MQNNTMLGRGFKNFLDAFYSDEARQSFANMSAGQGYGEARGNAQEAILARQERDQQARMQQMMFNARMQDRNINNEYKQAQIEKLRNPNKFGVPSQVTAFNSMTEGLTDEQRRNAQLIELGLAPRASSGDLSIHDIGGVPHRYNRQTDSMEPINVGGENIDANSIADTEALIAGQKKFGEGVGSFNATSLQEAYQSFGKASESLYNINEAISAIDRGARIGVVENMLPSIMAASVELDNIRNKMGLDVIGAVTFGALSKGELDIALSTAMPKFANPEDARDWLVRRADSQQKLMTYYQEQMQHLNGGGSVIDFLQEKGAARRNVPAIQQNSNGLPQPGEERDGYIFLGGDPANKESWRLK